jgi:CHAT domain-containing protein
MDRVVSSTIPTVRALLKARHDMHNTARRPAVLVVAMPATPDQTDLPGAKPEAQLITEKFPGSVAVLGLPGGPPASHATVTAQLQNHSWVHFACHGSSDLADPSASCLLLTDWQTHPLTVLDLTGMRLTATELAFLSACSTARGGATLPDEAIHLAGACALAGYGHVIAALWPIRDADAVRVTNAVYARLAEEPERRDHALAMHTAIRALRDGYAESLTDQPSRWASHTHTGA